MLWSQERSHLVGNFLEGDVSQCGKRSRCIELSYAPYTRALLFFKALLTIFAESPYKIKYRAFLLQTVLLFFQHKYIPGLCF